MLTWTKESMVENLRKKGVRLVSCWEWSKDFRDEITLRKNDKMTCNRQQKDKLQFTIEKNI